MEKTRIVAAEDEEVSFATLKADPEIAALLEFEPAPRKVRRPDGWTAKRQREFIAWLAHEGVPSRAADRMRKNVSGIEAIYRGGEDADSFRAAWDAALELAAAREEARRQAEERFVGRAPGINVRPSAGSGPAPSTGSGRAGEDGQILNEFGEWEDEQSYYERAEAARQRNCGRLLRIRRLFLQEISRCPGKRAAFEILTELPVDWEKAERLEAQDDEPYRTSNQRQSDMVLMAESGWSFGDAGYGRDRTAEARAAIDAWRAEHGMPAVEWSESTERSDDDA